MSYQFRGFEIPSYMEEGLHAYINYGRPPGGFLQAVLENNLVEAAKRADDINLINLPAYAAYLHNEVPMACWGSEDKIEHWIEKGGYNGGQV